MIPRPRVSRVITVPTRASGSRGHEPRFSSASVHYLLSAQQIGSTDLARSARALLDADLAVSAAWPTETAVRVPYRLRKEARRIRRLRELKRLWDEAQHGTWQSALRLGLRSPRIGVAFLRAKWVSEVAAPRVKRLAESPTISKVLGLLVLHPIITTRRVLPAVRLRRRADGDDTVEAGSATQSDATEHLVQERLEHDSEANSVVEDDESDPFAPLLETLAEADRVYLDRQVVSVAIRLSDQHLFGGPDRDEDGFVRLMLRESYHDFVLPGSDDEHHVVFEPRLLLHQSGVLQLDLALSVHSHLQIEQVVAMLWGPEELFVRSRMSTPLLAGTSWEHLADYSAEEVDAGHQLGVIEHSVPVSMSAILHVHLAAIMATTRRTYSFWMIYPVGILDPVECCAAETWKKEHRQGLLRLANRAPADSAVAHHVDLPQDLSYSAARSLYANLGSAVFFQWEGDAPKGIAELNTVLVIEYALLLYMRLHVMEEELSRLMLGERELRSRYSAAVRLFSELRQRDLRSGETRAIVRHVLESLGAPEMRRTIETALDLSTAAYSTLSAERAARRAWWVTLAATLLAFLVAAPTIRELLGGVPDVRPGDAWVLSPLRWLRDSGFAGPWIAIAGILLLVVLMLSLAMLWRNRPRRLQSIRRGYKWPVEFRVKRDSSSPTRRGPRTTDLVATFPADDRPRRLRSHSAQYLADEDDFTAENRPDAGT